MKRKYGEKATFALLEQSNNAGHSAAFVATRLDKYV